MEHNVLASIITPFFNRAYLLKETIESVQSQTSGSWELILVDDGSDDGAFEIAKEYETRYENIHFVKRSKNPKGASTCRNIGASLAKGQYLIFLDSDDLLAPFCIESRLSFFQENPVCDFLVFPIAYFDATPGDSDTLLNELDTGENDLDRFLAGDLPWITSGVIWRKDSFERLGGFDESLLASQDVELHIRALAMNLHYKKPSNLFDCFYRKSNHESISKDSIKDKEKIRSRILLRDRICACGALGEGQTLLKRKKLVFNSLSHLAFNNYLLSPNIFSPKDYISCAIRNQLILHFQLFFYSIFLSSLWLLEKLNLRFIGLPFYSRVKNKFFPLLTGFPKPKVYINEKQKTQYYEMCSSQKIETSKR